MPDSLQGQAIYLVQEYCTTDLAALLRRLDVPPPECIAKGLILQLCRGLAALHAEGAQKLVPCYPSGSCKACMFVPEVRLRRTTPRHLP
jgi:hypothetical protein